MVARSLGCKVCACCKNDCNHSKQDHGRNKDRNEGANGDLHRCESSAYAVFHDNPATDPAHEDRENRPRPVERLLNPGESDVAPVEKRHDDRREIDDEAQERAEVVGPLDPVPPSVVAGPRWIGVPARGSIRWVRSHHDLPPQRSISAWPVTGGGRQVESDRVVVV